MASGIIKFIKKVCVQTAVYWDPLSPDGYGGYQYSEPVEIKCRWTEKAKRVTSDTGEVFVSVGEVLITEDLELGGYLYLGGLEDLSSEATEDPQALDKAYKIEARDKIPLFASTDEFVRAVYLGKNQRV